LSGGSRPYDGFATTFSIVGVDLAAPAWGIAVASRFLAVGARTCWGAADAGVAVIQAHFNVQNGVAALDLMRSGVPAPDAVDRLMAADPHRALRQIAAIDRAGRVATYTGGGCQAWAGGRAGRSCAAQGNMLHNGRGVEAMVDAFEASAGSLARRLVDALAVGDAIGGDARGRESAALLVVRPAPGEHFDVFSYRSIDLRVDDHSDPFTELSRLLDLHDLVHETTAPDEQLTGPDVVVRLQRALRVLGYYDGPFTGTLDADTRAAIKRLAYYHNLRRRVREDADWIDGRVLDYAERRARGAGG
jgi:uncharacterized Ntn-hydrolase superfamily protein